MAFSQDITDFILKTGLRADIVLRKLAFDAYLGLLLRSPVDQGRYRASHRIAINRVDPSVEEPDDAPYDEPSDLEIKANATIGGASIGDSIFITNNLPYAQPLEDGHSKQAEGPNAVYGNTFEELVRGFAKTVRSVR